MDKTGWRMKNVTKHTPPPHAHPPTHRIAQKITSTTLANYLTKRVPLHPTDEGPTNNVSMLLHVKDHYVHDQTNNPN